MLQYFLPVPYVVLLESCHKNAILHIFLGITAYVAVEITELPYAKDRAYAHTHFVDA